MKNKKSNFKLPNISKVIIPTIILLTLLITGITMYPIFTLKEQTFKSTPEPTKTELIKNSYVKVIDYNPFSPKAFVINDPKNDELIKKSYIVYLVYYTRTSITELKITKEIEIIVRNKSFEELKSIFSSDSVLKNNPDPDNLSIPCIDGYCKKPQRLSDEEYRKNQDSIFINKTYFGVKNKSEKKRSIEVFKKLKKGMIMQDIRKIVGPADVKGIDNLNYTKSWEALYDIDDTPGVNMVILSLEGLADSPEDYPLEKLIKIFYVNNQNEVFELKIEN
jgi:hypothetical protein